VAEMLHCDGPLRWSIEFLSLRQRGFLVPVVVQRDSFTNSDTMKERGLQEKYAWER